MKKNNIVKNFFIKNFFIILSCLFLFYLNILLVSSLFSQGIPIGHWRHHLPNNTIISLTEAPNKIIGASPYSLVIYNKNDNSIERFNKVHGLSDLGISQIKYVSESDVLFIAYENGNIDLKKNNTVYNIPDIKDASIIGSKKINDILIYNDNAYLATGFGIVNLNLSGHTIHNTYYIGPEGSQIFVNDLMFTEEFIYAATEGGVFKADVNAPNLADYNYWERIKDLPDTTANCNFIASFADHVFANITTSFNDDIKDTLYYYDNNKWNIFNPGDDDYFHPKKQIRSYKDQLLIVTKSFIDVFDKNFDRIVHVDNYHDGTPNPYDAIIDYEGFLWIGDDYHGMVQMTSEQSSKKIRLRGPSSSSSYALAASMDNIWVAPGSKSPSGHNLWNYNGFFRFTDERWRNYNRFNYEEMDRVFDIIDVAVDPGNPHRVALSSWYDGILLFENYTLTGKYGMNNYDEHTLRPRIPHLDKLRVSSTAFDKNGNLWVANALVDRPLSVRKQNGDWLSFHLNGLVQSSWLTGNIVIDDYSQKWISLPDGKGIIVFKENSLENNNDYEVMHITTTEGSGGLPSNEVTALAKDNDGHIWVATSEGVVVFYSPNRILTSDPSDAQPIILDEDGFAGLLFENETINSITVDGSNKKWFGTSRAGVFLMEEDGRSTIHNFTTNNSPIPSNFVRDIAVEPSTGEVFFATDRGIASFRSFATEGKQKHSDVYAFPNPVRPGYNGYIAVKGLVANANVKITDINGNLVYETIAEGGQAIWDGNNMRGKRPGSGVYLVFSTNEDGSETIVTKILFLN